MDTSYNGLMEWEHSTSHAAAQPLAFGIYLGWGLPFFEQLYVRWHWVRLQKVKHLTSASI